MSDFPDAQTRYEQALAEIAEALRAGRPLPNTEVYERRVVNIPVLRQRHGLTQQQFADRLGISVGTLRNWEQRRRIPDGPAQRLLELIEDRAEVAADILSVRSDSNSSQKTHQEQSAGRHAKTFTPRELQVLRCLRMGMQNKLIASRLNLAESTVKIYIFRILKKLNVSTRTQAALLARDHGIGNADDISIHHGVESGGSAKKASDQTRRQ